jgi:hypothetical protein
MPQKTIIPNGCPCTLEECPPGPFVPQSSPDMLCFKSEYGNSEGSLDAYNSAGEYYHGEGMVQPVKMISEDVDQ